MIDGVDVSEWQGTDDWSPSGIDFIGIRASFGMTVVDRMAAQHAEKARQAGLVVGFYHFGIVSDYGGGAAQADYFLDAIPDLRAGEWLCYDWEPYDGQEPSVAQRDAFLERLRERKPGHRIVLYCNPSDVRDDPTPGWVEHWLAHWTSADHPGDEGQPWTIWQYTDHPIDQDRADFPSRESMRNWAAGSSSSGGWPFGLKELRKWDRTEDQVIVP